MRYAAKLNVETVYKTTNFFLSFDLLWSCLVKRNNCLSAVIKTNRHSPNFDVISSRFMFLAFRVWSPVQSQASVNWGAFCQ